VSYSGNYYKVRLGLCLFDLGLELS